MNINHDDSVLLTTDPAEHPHVFAAAFNAGTPELTYEPGAVLVRLDGVAVQGRALTEANAQVLALGLPIAVRPRRVAVAGDIALLIVDWTLESEDMRIAATATDVARRGPDGRWRYVIDNPYGIAAGTPSAS